MAIQKFRLLPNAGNHTEPDGRIIKISGTIFESNYKLDKMFVNKFELMDPNTTVPDEFKMRVAQSDEVDTPIDGDGDGALSLGELEAAYGALANEEFDLGDLPIQVHKKGKKYTILAGEDFTPVSGGVGISKKQVVEMIVEMMSSEEGDEDEGDDD